MFKTWAELAFASRHSNTNGSLSLLWARSLFVYLELPSRAGEAQGRGKEILGLQVCYKDTKEKKKKLRTLKNIKWSLIILQPFNRMYSSG